MASIKQLRELAERLGKATGPSRDVDVSIDNVFGIARWDKGPWVPDEGHIHEKRLEPIPVSSSLDAALALVERLLPGSEYEITTMYGVARVALPLNSSNFGPSHGSDETGNVPLAILRAMVKAMIAEAA